MTIVQRLSRPGVGLGLVLLVALAVLLPGVNGSFSSDDYVHLSRNLDFGGLWQVLGVFTQTDGREYRPLVRVSLWLNAQTDETALAFKLTNVLLHLLTTALLYRLLRRVEVGLWPGLAGALLFALHPIHTTSIHFIMGRTDLLASVFYLAALLLGLSAWQRRHLGAWVASLLAGAAALASKELAVTLPGALLLLMWLVQRPASVGAAARSVLPVLPMAALVSAYLLMRLLGMANHTADFSVYTQFSVGGVVRNYAEWLFALVYPLDLYHARFTLETSPRLFLMLAGSLSLLLAGLLALLFWPARRALVREPLIWLGAAWLLLVLLPMAGGNAHRWYLYLPSAGLSFMLAGVMRAGCGQVRRQLALALLGLVLVFCAAETFRQSLIWHQQHRVSEAFFSAVERSGLLDEKEAALANVPFGYGSAFLFSFRSLEDALRQRYGEIPHLYFTHYINLDRTWEVDVQAGEQGLTFTQTPSALEFFLLPPAQRRVPPMASHTAGDWHVVVLDTTPAGHIRQLRVEPQSNSPVPLYYFDGSDLKRARSSLHGIPR